MLFASQLVRVWSRAISDKEWLAEGLYNYFVFIATIAQLVELEPDDRVAHKGFTRDPFRCNIIQATAGAVATIAAVFPVEFQVVGASVYCFSSVSHLILPQLWIKQLSVLYIDVDKLFYWTKVSVEISVEPFRPHLPAHIQQVVFQARGARPASR